jgi:hypothetical protein
MFETTNQYQCFSQKIGYQATHPDNPVTSFWWRHVGFAYRERGKKIIALNNGPN